jgi:O-antigen biosynthesis protein
MRNPHWLFDSSFYCEHNPGVERAGILPFCHFLLLGLIERRDPHPLFDTAYYLDTNPDVAAGRLPPFLHFLRAGAAEGRSPHPLFDPAFYLRQLPRGERPAAPPLRHFLQQGVHRGYNPHPLFDVAYYLQSNPTVESTGMNPLLHYLSAGAREKRNPHPLFDSPFYLDRNPDVAQAGIDPLVHYLRSGAAEGRNPHPLFDTRYYLASNPDVAQAGVNPLVHFVLSGAAEARSPHPCFSIPTYFQRHPEAAESAENPLVHYLNHHTPANDSREPYILPSPRQAKLAEAIAGVSAAVLRASGDPIQFPAAAQPEVSVIVCGHNRARYSFDCLRALALAMEGIAYEVLFVDDASTDETPQVLSQAPGLRYLRNPSNIGFLRSVNRAAREARGGYLLLLNNDTLPLGGFCQALQQVFLEHPKAGLAGAMLLYPDASLQEAGGVIWSDGSGCNFGKHDDPGRMEYNYLREVDYCSAACVMIPRAGWERLGGFSERFAPCYYEDTDLAFRVRAAGLQVFFQPLAKVVHFEGATAGTSVTSGAKRYQQINREKFAERWASVLRAHGTADTFPSYLHDRYPLRRALVIDATTPTPDRDSGSQDTYHLLRTLKEMEWHVSFIPESNLLHFGHYTEDLQRMGVECLYAPYLASISSYLETHAKSFDLIVFCRVTTATSYLGLARKAAPAAKILFDTVDLHFLREEREARLLGSATLLEKALATRQREFAVMRQADVTIVRTNVERDLVAQGDPRIRLEVLPLMRPVVGRHAGFKTRDRIAFIGSFGHPPNVDAALYFAERVWPAICERLPGSRLAIVGADPPESVRRLAGDRIGVLGHVSDLQALLERCRVTVAPLRFGAGQKGKVLSSLAHGVPCVMTSLAAEGMGIVQGENGLVADLPEPMAQAVIEVYSNPQLWLRLSEGGLGLVARRFSVESGTRLIGEIAGRLLARPGEPFPLTPHANAGSSELDPQGYLHRSQTTGL